jgi:acyl carrier protein
VPDDLDILSEGLIDSFGILELISELERQFGLELDLEELPAEELTRVGPLSRFVARKAAAEAAGTREPA